MGKWKVVVVFCVSFLCLCLFNTAQSSNVPGYISKEEFVQKIKESPYFFEYADQMLTDIDSAIIEEATSDTGVLTGYATTVEIETIKKENIPSSVNNNLSYNATTTITSLLTFYYEFANDKIESIVFDYSNLESDGEVVVLSSETETSSAIEFSELPENLVDLQEKMSYDKSSMVIESDREVSLLALPPVDCQWLVCTKRKTGGGEWHDACSNIGNAICNFLPGKIKNVPISAICSAGVLIACYIPKYETCIDWYWEYKYCPVL